MTKFEEDFNYLIRLSGNVSIGQADFELFEKNRIAFFENYETGQQQALPVVPEDIDKAIKYLKTENNFATFADFHDILTEKGLKWLNDFQFKDRRFGFGGLNNKLFILSHLAITGYTVEKPQLEDGELQEQLNTAKKALTEAIGDIEQLNGSDDTIKYYKQALAAIGEDKEIK